jgi:hypothetical protein
MGLVTEPEAVATGCSYSPSLKSVFPDEITNGELSVGSGRYRFRFCNDSPGLPNNINSIKVHQHGKRHQYTNGARC